MNLRSFMEISGGEYALKFYPKTLTVNDVVPCVYMLVLVHFE